MKKLILIVLLFVVIFPVAGQGVDSVKTTKNQVNLDVNLLGLGLTIHKPINDKYAFTFGVQGGLIVNYFPFFYGYKIHSKVGSLDYNYGYYEKLSLKLGVLMHCGKHWEHSLVMKLGFPKVLEGINYETPYGGFSFQTFYKISPTTSIGTNIDVGLIKIDNVMISGLTTSFITLRLKIGK